MKLQTLFEILFVIAVLMIVLSFTPFSELTLRDLIEYIRG